MIGAVLKTLAGWRGYALTAAAMLAIGVSTGWTVRDWKASADTAHDRIHAAEVKAAAIADALALERSQAKVSDQVETRSVARQAEIRTVTQTIIERIPVYVPAEADARFALPAGLVRLHDAAALGLPLSDAAGQPDDPAGFLEPSDIAPSRLGATIVENYGVCHADAARLSAFQDWALQQAAVMNRP